ncbi:MAG: hypothetical protein IH855_09370 [Bacteroidetes bacterium]|nr:hypothetical protein [Bacteroidota bacterium]
MSQVAIGIRAFTNGFSYVALSGTQSNPKIESYERYSFPSGNQDPQNLSWLRKQLAEVVERVAPTCACIKMIEPVSRKKSPGRIRVEAVVLEYLYTSLGIVCSERIKAQLRRDIQDFDDPARYLEKVLSDSDTLDTLNHASFQEATLTAIAELPA